LWNYSFPAAAPFLAREGCGADVLDENTFMGALCLLRLAAREALKLDPNNPDLKLSAHR
jgi:hypothetical protein